jgi:hypothetical protein
VKDISKQYPLLTADERFRLFVEAMGRKDEQELDRLEATCPRKHYTAQDYDYTQKKMRFIVYSLASALELLRLDLLAYVALMTALAADDDTGDEEKALSMFRQLMQLRQGKRNGWLQFCARIGVSPTRLRPDSRKAPSMQQPWPMRSPRRLKTATAPPRSKSLQIDNLRR